MRIAAPQRVVVLTGAAGGIGAACAVALSRRGFALVLMGRHLPSLEAVRRALGPQAQAIVLARDVANAHAADEAVALCMRTWGRLDVVINNAAVIEPIAPLHETDPRLWRECIDVNVFGPYLLARAALKPFLAAGGGIIVNVGSGASHRPITGWSAYCCSKSALSMLTQVLHDEYANRGVCAVDFQPGRVATAMRQTILERQPERQTQDMAASFWPAEYAAQAMGWLCDEGGQIYAGRQAALHDPMLQRYAGLSPGIAEPRVQAPKNSKLP